MLRQLTYPAFPRVDQLFQEVFADGPTAVRGTTPAADLWEDDAAIQLRLDVPGWSMDELEVTVHRDVIRIRGTRTDATSGTESEDTQRWLRRERRSQSFERAFRLPFETESGKVAATLEGGVLSVTLPKAESALPRRIEVRALPGT